MKRYNLFLSINSGDMAYEKLFHKISLVDKDKRKDVYIDPICMVSESEFWRVMILGTGNIGPEKHLECEDISVMEYVIDIMHGRQIEELKDKDMILSVYGKLLEWDMKDLARSFIIKQHAKKDIELTIPDQYEYKEWVMDNFPVHIWSRMLQCKQVTLIDTLFSPKYDFLTCTDLITIRRFSTGYSKLLDDAVARMLGEKECICLKCNMYGGYPSVDCIPRTRCASHQYT